jgi:hypothetical protein
MLSLPKFSLLILKITNQKKIFQNMFKMLRNTTNGGGELVNGE